MDYYRNIQNAIEFIEENLQNESTMAEISSRAHFSPFHFQRIFQAIAGFSVQEYIRKRRLSESAAELKKPGPGILEIAISYGYGSQEAYSRAFRAYFGLSPAKYRNMGCAVAGAKKLNFFDYKSRIKGDMEMNMPEIKNMRKIDIVGYEYKTNLSDEKYFHEIPFFYDDFGSRESYLKIPSRCAPTIAYGVSCNYKQNREFSFVIGEEVSLPVDVSKLDVNFVHLVLPEGKYAIFKVTGSIEAAQNTWRYIYGTWLPNSNYERADGPDYEVTDVCNSINGLNMKIYIPLK